MRFTLRLGEDPHARADATLLAAMGLPGGGVVALGSTHVVVRPGTVPEPTALTVDPRILANTGLGEGSVTDVRRVLLPQARRVVIEGRLPADPQQITHALQGNPVTPGDLIAIDRAYTGDPAADPIDIRIAAVEPEGAALVGNATVVVSMEDRDRYDRAAPIPPPAATAPPTTAEAMLAGLDTELEALSGWLSLLTSESDLPRAWGLPRVAGVLVQGPGGVGKSELVAGAAARAGAEVREVSLDLVFKPDRLLDVLESAVRTAPTPGVVFLDRLEAVAGDEGMFRAQTAAVMRWFLDAVAERPRLATVIGVSSLSDIDPSLARSPLLPRSLTIPPPDLRRRRLLFESALHKIPRQDVDLDQLAARSAGFSGADILAVVVHASAMVARSSGPVTTSLLLDAIRDTVPSLGTSQLGEVPSFGFDRVANLETVKQRLTEAVIWPMTDPDRFLRLKIEPPRGILLHGPPGTGKTFVIRALAHEAAAAFFSVKGAELLDKFVGESERGVREVFARARAAAPSILFFDELDALAPIRGRSTTTVNDSVVAALLTELDGVADRGEIVVIGATNRIDLIDPALLRGGRFEVHIELGLPGAAARRAMLRISDIPFAPDVDLEHVVGATDGLSFADIESVLREAALAALRRDPGALVVSSADIAGALARGRS